MVQAVNSTRSNLEVNSTAVNNQPDENSNSFSWKKAALATGVGSLLVSSGLGIGVGIAYAIRKPNASAQNANCLSQCGFDSQCALNCEPRLTWPQTCSSLLNSAYEHSEVDISKTLVDQIGASFCEKDDPISRTALKEL